MKIDYKFKISLIFALSLLLIIPVVNLVRSDRIKFNKETLYNLDIFQTIIQKNIVYLGISLNPDSVYIGKEGWLFLGDKYQENVSRRREGVTQESSNTAETLMSNLSQWNAYFESRGATLFRVMIAPDKASIYPEYLPDWSKGPDISNTDTLLSKDREGLFFDPRPALWQAKSLSDIQSYWPIDTHWNSWGAWVAFKAFVESLPSEVKRRNQWLTEQNVILGDIIEKQNHTPVLFACENPMLHVRHNKGLAYLLKLGNFIAETKPVVSIDVGEEINLKIIDYENNAIFSSIGNPEINCPKKSLLAVNKFALNDKKILWLRDSFGKALSPYVSATFSHVLHVHHAFIGENQFQTLVEKYKPDYVFATIGERGLPGMVRFATTIPPQYSVTSKRAPQRAPGQDVRITHPIGMKDLKYIHDYYHLLSTKDPFVHFSVNEAVDTIRLQRVNFKLKCQDYDGPVALQLFWHEAETPYFNEKNSITFDSEQGDIQVEFNPNSLWYKANFVIGLRVDLNKSNNCKRFTLSNPVLY